MRAQDDILLLMDAQLAPGCGRGEKVSHELHEKTVNEYLTNKRMRCAPFVKNSLTQTHSYTEAKRFRLACDRSSVGLGRAVWVSDGPRTRPSGRGLFFTVLRI